jgi:hypothetical protein
VFTNDIIHKNYRTDHGTSMEKLRKCKIKKTHKISAFEPTLSTGKNFQNLIEKLMNQPEKINSRIEIKEGDLIKNYNKKAPLKFKPPTVNKELFIDEESGLIDKFRELLNIKSNRNRSRDKSTSDSESEDESEDESIKEELEWDDQLNEYEILIYENKTNLNANGDRLSEPAKRKLAYFFIEKKDPNLFGDKTDLLNWEKSINKSKIDDVKKIIIKRFSKFKKANKKQSKILPEPPAPRTKRPVVMAAANNPESEYEAEGLNLKKALQTAEVNKQYSKIFKKKTDNFRNDIKKLNKFLLKLNNKKLIGSGLLDSIQSILSKIFKYFLKDPKRIINTISTGHKIASTIKDVVSNKDKNTIQKISDVMNTAATTIPDITKTVKDISDGSGVYSTLIKNRM